MISRYSRPEMTALWSEEAKLSRWLEIEILACEAMANRRIIPRKDARTIRRKAKFNLRQVHRNEER
ncbi:MAG: adenylosuccinate lyase, partial [Proteobacteria bacterium]|nr:adenylosuccinate lyase [Pseudomonadota bacterium]